MGVVLLVAWRVPPSQQGACPSPSLPSYSHNDYENLRPLRDALELGFRGVEADVFLVGDSLRVGHDKRAAARGPTLESAYLRPLQDLVRRCAAPEGARSLFLFVEMKDETAATRAELARLLAGYAPSFRKAAGDSHPVIEIVLVGRARGARVDTISPFAGSEFELARRGDRPPRGESVRLLSLNYGKTLGRWWVRESGRARWFDEIRDLRREYPSSLIRVHNVPADVRTYRALLGAGVDLLGTKEIAATQKLLAP